MAPNKESLSLQFQRAYETSYRAAPDDKDEVVVEARKTLKSLRKKMKDKLKDVDEICEACRVVAMVHPRLVPIRDHACSVARLISHDLWRLDVETKRVK